MPLRARSFPLRALRVVGLNPLAVFARSDLVDPFLIVEIPPHRLCQTGLERLGGVPAPRALQLAGVDRITAVVARTVCHIRDLVAVRAGRLRTLLIEQIAQRMHDLEILLLVPAADVVRLAW